MNVVCDSSTLIALARIDCLWILEKQLRQLIIPREVYNDVVVKGAGKPGSEEIKKAKWLDVQGVKNRKIVKRLNTKLGLGESEAIALAKEIKADLVILDDEEARKIAESEGLKVVGLLAFLIMAKEKGLIGHVKILLDDLRTKDFFIGNILYQEILQRVGEI